MILDTANKEDHINEVTFGKIFESQSMKKNRLKILDSIRSKFHSVQTVFKFIYIYIYKKMY